MRDRKQSASDDSNAACRSISTPRVQRLVSNGRMPSSSAWSMPSSTSSKQVRPPILDVRLLAEELEPGIQGQSVSKLYSRNGCPSSIAGER